MKQIVIVEDDEALYDAFTLIFSPEQYGVTIFTDGYRILENQFETPDLFILDKQLPGIDGLDICQFLKTQPQTKDIPVIILSASTGIAEAYKAAGANDVLEKPFKIKALRDMIAKYI